MLIIAVALPSRLLPTTQGIFSFATDQGRDFIAVSEILKGNLTLIGPTTGIHGVFYGPWWYYFLSPLIFIFHGDPQIVAYIFSLIGVSTVVALFLLIKSITGNTSLAFGFSIIGALSKGFGNIAIWNPTLTPIFLIIFTYCLNKVFKKPKPIYSERKNSCIHAQDEANFERRSENHGPQVVGIYFFVLGISTFLAIDTTASFGTLLFIFLVVSPAIFKKELFKKEYILTMLGGLVILLPRILFEIRNNFLITRSAINYVISPKVFVQPLSLIKRLEMRAFQYLKIFSNSFSQDNLMIGMVIVVILIIILLLLISKKSILKLIIKDKILVYFCLLLVVSLIFFTAFPGNVWDYYLVALPTVFIVIIVKLFSWVLKIPRISKYAYVSLIVLIAANFNAKEIFPYKILWPGDDATYKNMRIVMDYIQKDNPHNYSYYAYTTSLIDYPFNYLFEWYSNRNLIEKPKYNQELMYLIIRNASTKQYLTTGWYLDKTHDKTTILESKQFPGDLLLEKHFHD